MGLAASEFKRSRNPKLSIKVCYLASAALIFNLWVKDSGVFVEECKLSDKGEK